ncbi:hypothetical protein yc1106_02946 [Curvularia clavata]|uniref:Inhibitor I9 domain-containing protein n=1 Tax=Curvularia clavata TaxID=95742 RepID=A0A9Q8Z3Q3_CURCL|nr:hypothetical protein yc1106_02946 [Curvularia clavata]
MAQFNVSIYPYVLIKKHHMLTPPVQITLKKDAPKEELEAAKKKVTDQGGKIVNEFTLIKGFTQTWLTSVPNSAEIPDDVVSTLESNEHVTVEKDQEVRTQ